MPTATVALVTRNGCPCLPAIAIERSERPRGSARELRKIQLFGHARRRQDGYATFIEEANVELLVPAGRRLELDLFVQRILVVWPFAQHGAQHVQFVG